MAGRVNLAQKVKDATAAPIAGLGLELVDVELVREGQSVFLRLYIDKPGGVGLDDCTAVSQLVDPLIDQQLDIHVHDYLEVSSPGLERPLKTDRDFVRCQGEWVELTCYKALDGHKKFQGKLAPCSAEMICLELEDGTISRFPRDQVARVRRTVRF